MGRDYVSIAHALAEPLANSLGLDIWGIEFVGGGRPTLRVFVEKQISAEHSDISDDEVKTMPDGVSVDECAELSRLLGLSLDVEESFDCAWVLEVSSPGLERIFFNVQQMNEYKGKEIDVLLSVPHPNWPVAEGLPGRKKFRGILVSIDEDSFVLSIPETTRLPEDPETVIINWGDVRRAHLIHTFPERSLPGKKAKKVKKCSKNGDDA